MLKLKGKRILPLTLVALTILGGCSSLAPQRQDNESGINLRYLFGDRRTVAEGTGSLVEDPKYSEYVEWKRWQDFQAYQEWKRLREVEGESTDSDSN